MKAALDLGKQLVAQLGRIADAVERVATVLEDEQTFQRERDERGSRGPWG